MILLLTVRHHVKQKVRELCVKGLCLQIYIINKREMYIFILTATKYIRHHMIKEFTLPPGTETPQVTQSPSLYKERRGSPADLPRQLHNGRP